MTEKEIAELRRRLRPEKCNITRVRGCMVGESGDILSRFDQSTALLNETECDQILSLFRKTLSGRPGRNLNDVAFTTAQVLDSEEHKLLTALRHPDPENEGDEAERLYRKIADSLSLEGGYLILLANDVYDVLSYRRDGSDGESVGVFPYLICCICPMKLTKAVLHYTGKEGAFEMLGADNAVSAPELGFLFPAFDDRTANIYGALYYTRDPSEQHAEVADAIFHAPLPMAQPEQTATFREIIADTVGESCDLDFVDSFQGQMAELIEEHKTSRDPEPLLLGKTALKQALLLSGMPEESTTAFEEKFDEAYGRDFEIRPEVLAETKKYQIETPDVTIKVNPERRDLVETRVIDGVKYILIRAEDAVEVNGVNIHIGKDE